MNSNKAKFVQEVGNYTVSVTGRHVQVTDAMKAYAIEKIAKIDHLDHLTPKIIDVNVVMDIQKLNHKVDILVKYGHTLIKSTGVTTDMYASVDQAVDRLQKRLKKYLSRIHEHHKKNHEIKEMEERLYAITEEEDINEAIEQESKQKLPEAFQLHHIVRTEKQPLKILTDAEAIMKMDLSQSPVIVYRGEEDRKLKVIYRREDGHYGVICAE